jgi:membrane-associated phospholipid phosphatase
VVPIVASGGSSGVAMIASTAVAMLFVIAVLVIQVRRSQWSDVDVSRPDQRAAFYPIAIAVSLGVLVSAFVFRFPEAYVRGSLSALLMILAGAFANRFVKLSLHCAFACFTALTFVPLSLILALLFAIFATAIAWSRLALRRHTPVEVILGSLLGVAGGALTVFVP